MSSCSRIPPTIPLPSPATSRLSAVSRLPSSDSCVSEAGEAGLLPTDWVRVSLSRLSVFPHPSARRLPRDSVPRVYPLQPYTFTLSPFAAARMKFRASSPKWPLFPRRFGLYPLSPRHLSSNLFSKSFFSTRVSVNGGPGNGSKEGGNFFLVPGATVATILMVGVLHARRIYDDKKIEEAKEKGVEFEFSPDAKAAFLRLLPLRSISRLWGSYNVSWRTECFQLGRVQSQGNDANNVVFSREIFVFLGFPAHGNTPFSLL